MGSKSRRLKEMNSSVLDLSLKLQKKQLVAVGTRNENQIAMSLDKRAHLGDDFVYLEIIENVASVLSPCVLV